MSLSPVKNSSSVDLESIFSDRGLEGTLPGPEHESRLPDFNSLQPPAIVITSEIDRMLGRSNIEDIVMTAIAPQVPDRFLLRPERFSAALEHSLEALRATHSEEEGSPAQLATRAFSVLQEEMG